MTGSQDKKKIRKLVSLAADGMISAPQALQLEALLRSNPAMMEEYTAAVTTESLIEIHSGKSLLGAGDLQDHRTCEPSGAGSPPGKAGAPTWRAASEWLYRFRHVTPYAVAAVLLLGISLLLFQRTPAHIVASDDADWADHQARRVGESISRGWLELTEGEVKLSFGRGGMASVRAPAVFRAVSGSRLDLRSGVVSVHVPEHAAGFVVDTPAARITDLGTGFRAGVSDTGALELQVTEGRVRLGSKSTGEEVELDAGQIAEVAEASAPIEVRGAAPTAVSNTVRFLEEHPQSLRYRAFDRDDSIAVFLEASRVELRRDLRLNVGSPGRHERFTGGLERLRAGDVVACYLVHCAPERRRHVVEGQMTFPGKILGIVCDSDSLNATNTLLGTGWTLQCNHPERGLESTPDRNSDLVVISADRQTLRVRLRTESIDQLRVLVAADQ